MGGEGEACPQDPHLTVKEREHFIPIRKSDLIEKLSQSTLIPPDQRAAFIGLCRLLEATFHYQFHCELERLKDAYARFDPDAATLRQREDTSNGDSAATDDLFERFDSLLAKANYRRLDRQHIEAAIGAASDWGVRLDVDLGLFERLEVYVRGDVVGRRTRRRLRGLYRSEEVDVAMYQQLAVIFRLRDHCRLEQNVLPNTVYVKLFKNIPKQDLDMLLPGSRVKMTLVDQSRILLPTISGAALSLYKVIKLLAFASLYGMFVFLAAVCGTFGYGVKSFLGYVRTKDKYQHHLTRSLYYQNLDNNAGVLFRLLDEAEEQEFREAIVAYVLLWQKPDGEQWTCERIDREAEQLLWELAQVNVDFEVDDAITKLERLGLAERNEQGHWTALPVDAALRQLDAAWDRYFEYDNAPDPTLCPEERPKPS